MMLIPIMIIIKIIILLAPSNVHEHGSRVTANWASRNGCNLSFGIS